MLDDSWVVVDQEINLDAENTSWDGQRWRKFSEDTFSTYDEAKEESEQCSKKHEMKWSGEIWRKYI